jgi:hypothetical protein
VVCGHLRVPNGQCLVRRQLFSKRLIWSGKAQCPDGCAQKPPTQQGNRSPDLRGEIAYGQGDYGSAARDGRNNEPFFSSLCGTPTDPIRPSLCELQTLLFRRSHGLPHLSLQGTRVPHAAMDSFQIVQNPSIDDRFDDDSLTYPVEGLSARAISGPKKENVSVIQARGAFLLASR